MLVAHQEQRALKLRGNIYARDRDVLGLGQLLDERRRAAQALVRWRHKGKLAVIDGGEQLGRHAEVSSASERASAERARSALADVSVSGSYSPTVMAALPLTSTTSMSTPSRAV